jgi:hypothetical protein
MRAVEARYLREVETTATRRLELHRMHYAYFLDRLVELMALPVEQQDGRRAEIGAIARSCRHERAAYLQMSAAKSDEQHGTVIEVARSIVNAKGITP